MVDTQNQIEELSFERYTLRQEHEITPEGLKARAEKVRASDKFNNHNGVWEKVSYPGYAVVSMVYNNPGNALLAIRLEDIQQRLIGGLTSKDKCFLLPAESFHQTVANTLSSSRFEKYIRDAGIEKEYPSKVKAAFNQLDLTTEEEPIEMSMIGLSIFGSAVGILGTFQKASDFQRIVDFRNAFYSVPELNAIDIKRTRPFIGHITLAYLDGDFSLDERDQLYKVCNEVNQYISSESLMFKISNTELRKYDDLSQFQTYPHFPKYSFITH